MNLLLPILTIGLFLAAQVLGGCSMISYGIRDKFSTSNYDIRWHMSGCFPEWTCINIYGTIHGQFPLLDVVLFDDDWTCVIWMDFGCVGSIMRTLPKSKQELAGNEMFWYEYHSLACFPKSRAGSIGSLAPAKMEGTLGDNNITEKI